MTSFIFTVFNLNHVQMPAAQADPCNGAQPFVICKKFSHMEIEAPNVKMCLRADNKLGMALSMLCCLDRNFLKVNFFVCLSLEMC